MAFTNIKARGSASVWKTLCCASKK